MYLRDISFFREYIIQYLNFFCAFNTLRMEIDIYHG